MRAIVFAGGLGMRLRPYTTVLPKPLMPVGDRPLLELIIEQLHSAAFERVTISTGHLSELIEAYFGDGSKWGVPIDYFRETEPLGTVGSLALIDGLDDDFLAMNGDVLTDLDYRRLIADHLGSDAIATIATTKRNVEIALGVMRFNGEDPTRVSGYEEKPHIDYEASMGVFCLSPKIREYIDAGRRLDFPDLVLRLLAAGEIVRAWSSQAYWLDIGRPEEYERALDEFDQMRGRLLPS
jgi:NDP-mannose synthase